MAAIIKLLLIVVCSVCVQLQVSRAVRVYGNYTGDILLAAFFPVHRRIGADDPSSERGSVCGEIQEEDGVQAMEAFYYTLDKINHHPTLLRGYTLGAVVLDSCDDDTHALEQAVELIRVLMTRDDISDLPYRCPGGVLPILDPGAEEFYKIVGVVGGSTSSVSLQLASLLKLFYLPQVSYLSTSPDLSNVERFPFFKRTVPSDSYQAKAIVELLRQFGWTYVSMIYEDSNYGIKGYGELERAANENGICFAYLKRIDFDEPEWGPADYEGIIKGMTAKDRSNVAVLWADFPRARELFEAAERLNKTNIIWVGSDGWSGRTLAVEDLGHVVKKAIAVQPLAWKLGGFDNHFTSLNVTNMRNPWLREYWEHHFNCKWPKGKTDKDRSSENAKTDKYLKLLNDDGGILKECTGKEVISKENGYKQQLSVHFISDAAFAFAHALAAMHEDLCRGQDGLCKTMSPSNISGAELLAYLAKVNFSSASGEDFRFINDMDGPPRYTIMNLRQKENSSFWQEVGTYKAQSKMSEGVLELEPKFRDHAMSEYPPSSCSVPCGPQQARTYVKGDRCCWVCTNCTMWSIVYTIGDEEICVPCPHGMEPNANMTSCKNMVATYMSHTSPWGIASMSIAILFTIYAAFTTVVFGLYHSTPVVKASGRELSFILLAIIILSYLSTFIFIAKPSATTCGLTRILLGICYAGIYASILAKASRISRIFNDGAGSPKRARLTSPRSQLLIVGLLLVVEVLVLAVWFAASPPGTKYVFPDRATRLHVCKGSDDASYLIALIYPFLLMLTCLVYAFKTRKTPDGFNETRLITFTSYTTVVIWLAFITLFFINQYNNEVRITTLWVSLTLNATVALSCLLVPKVYICLFRPEKNTREAVMTRSQSVLSSSSLPNPLPDLGRGKDSPDTSRRNSRRSSSIANQTWQTGILNGGVIGTSPGSSLDKSSPMKARKRTNSATQTTFDVTFYAPVYDNTDDETNKPQPETTLQEKYKKTYAWDTPNGYADPDDVTLEFPVSDSPGRGGQSKAQFRRVSIAKLKELPGIDEGSSTT